jgi:hypothetical protein
LCYDVVVSHLSNRYGEEDSNDDFTKKTCDQLFGPKVFEQVMRETKRLGGAAMLTEWVLFLHR